jgi:succinate dehydrogenase hydrophobic anchor subunit
MATLSKNKKGVEAWWGFLAGAIIVIVVAIVLLVFYGKIKIGGESAVLGIFDKLGQMFR